MISLQRRDFIKKLGVTGAWLAMGPSLSKLAGAPMHQPARMTICLAGGSIGVTANQREAIELAYRHGFESVTPDGGYLSSLSPTELNGLVAELNQKRLVWGAAGLPVNFRGEEAAFQNDLRKLVPIAAGLQRAGVDRIGTWLSPAHPTLTYRNNFQLHAKRLRETATVLKDHGLRLGLEYVGTKTLLIGRKYPFVHTLSETRELIAEIGTGNVGLVLDTWHWWQAEDTTAEIEALTGQDIISMDLNDAPRDVEFDRQRDNQRELPTATGVIDVAAFLQAVQKTGYTGPARAEPFNRILNDMNNDDACAATAKSMKQAFALIY